MLPQNMSELREGYSRVSLALMAYTAVMEIAAFLLMIPVGMGLIPDRWMELYQNALNPIVVYPAGLLIIGGMLKRNPTPRLRKTEPTGPQILSGLFAGLGVLYFFSIITQTLLENTETTDYANEAVSETPFAVAIVTTVILAPVFEELIFRHLMLDRLLYLGDASALLLSSLFFGLFHTNLYQFGYAFGVGLVLGYIRIMTGSMKWNILLHMFINFFCGVLPGYLPDQDWIDHLMVTVVLLAIVYAGVYMVRNRPWQNLYAGPTGFAPAEKCRACFTAPAFWICVVVHLALSVYFITL